MCAIRDSTVTGSGGFPSLFLSFFTCWSTYLSSESECFFSLPSHRRFMLNWPKSLRQVQSSSDVAVHITLTRDTSSLWQPWQVLSVGADNSLFQLYFQVALLEAKRSVSRKFKAGIQTINYTDALGSARNFLFQNCWLLFWLKAVLHWHTWLKVSALIINHTHLREQPDVSLLSNSKDLSAETSCGTSAPSTGSCVCMSLRLEKTQFAKTIFQRAIEWDANSRFQMLIIHLIYM